MTKETFEILSNPKRIFSKMLKDIDSAKSNIYLENYIYEHDEIGRAFRDALVEKAKQGVKVKVLLDAWGTRLPKNYWMVLESFGGEVRYFRQLQYAWRMISVNHERNHQKLLLIDDKITYIGSSNITHRFINWRELQLRLVGDKTEFFVKAFNGIWRNHTKLRIKRIARIIYKDFEILQDLPSFVRKLTERRYIKLLKNAKREINIETPYLVPSFNLRRAFVKAVARGVKVRLILPYRSNWKIADIIRNRYLGFLSRGGVEIYYYNPRMLHSKLLIVDNKFFILGSSNLDYRSLRHNYEINLLGKNKKIVLE